MKLAERWVALEAEAPLLVAAVQLVVLFVMERRRRGPKVEAAGNGTAPRVGV